MRSSVQESRRGPVGYAKEIAYAIDRRYPRPGIRRGFVVAELFQTKHCVAIERYATCAFGRHDAYPIGL